MIPEIPGVVPENQDIIDYGFDAETTARFIQLRRRAPAIVRAATESPEGLENLGRLMRFLNDRIESTRKNFTK